MLFRSRFHLWNLCVVSHKQRTTSKTKLWPQDTHTVATSAFLLWSFSWNPRDYRGNYLGSDPVYFSRAWIQTMVWGLGNCQWQKNKWCFFSLFFFVLFLLWSLLSGSYSRSCLNPNLWPPHLSFLFPFCRYDFCQANTHSYCLRIPLKHFLKSFQILQRNKIISLHYLLWN